MRLATFEMNKKEAWGVVLFHPYHKEEWIFIPEKVQKCLDAYCTRTSPYFLNKPVFLVGKTWPESLTDFLHLEDEGMNALRRMEDFLKIFLEKGDQAGISSAGYPIRSIKMKAPIPRPRLYWGLVQNCPTFVRNNPNRKIANFFPQGHQRPQGAVVGHGEHVVHTKDHLPWAYNVELGVIIGKKGRYITADKAMDHIAGYTVITDCSSAAPFHTINGSKAEQGLMGDTDWFLDAMASWGGKKSDTLAPMGPYLVTKDEIGNPYDLMVYTRKSGMLRDRAHTGALVLGIERVVSWYSSFATLYPGDVIHMATMGVDGLGCDEDTEFGPLDYIETEIEKIGILKNPVVIVGKEDWRSELDEGKRVHPSPAVREIIQSGHDAIPTPEAWNVAETRHFWTIFGNYLDVERQEKLKISKHPRFLNGPSSALSAGPVNVVLTPRTTELHVGVELAFVVGKLAHKVKKEVADEYILGFTPMVSLSDCSFAQDVIEPATKQEKGITAVYARWADGYNIVLSKPVKVNCNELSAVEMLLNVNGSEVKGNTDEYVLKAPEVLEYITQFITLFPGDVITLGRIADIAILEKEAAASGVVGRARIGRLGEVEFTLKK